MNKQTANLNAIKEAIYEFYKLNNPNSIISIKENDYESKWYSDVFNIFIGCLNQMIIKRTYVNDIYVTILLNDTNGFKNQLLTYLAKKDLLLENVYVELR